MANLALTPQKIIKLSPYRFQCSTGPESLTMDFEAIKKECDRLHPSEKGEVLHWQAKPFGQRRWGEFWWDGADTGYRTWNPDDQAREGLHYLIQVDESQLPGVKPTAVLYYPATPQMTAEDSNAPITNN